MDYTEPEVANPMLLNTPFRFEVRSLARARAIPTVLVAGLLLLLSTSANAQNWSGILSPNRAVDWSGAGVSGGIPNRQTNCVTSQCNTLFGGTVTAASINSAITSAPNNTVVRVPAGTYAISGTIDFGGRSNVTLRGAGSNSTFITFSSVNSGSCGFSTAVCISTPSLQNLAPPCGGAPPCAGAMTTWTGGYAIGTTQLTVGSTAGMSTSSLLFLDQLDDTSDGYPAKGDIAICGTSPSFCLTTNGDEFFSRTSVGNAGNRGQQEQQIITQIVDGTHINISPGIRLPNWRSSQRPAAFTGKSFATLNGIESMSLNNQLGGINSNIMMSGCIQCWAKGVRVLNASSRNHVWLYQCNHCEVRDSYFYGSANGAGSTSYGIEFAQTDGCKVENNIFQHETLPINVNGSDVGSVIAHNFSIDDNYTAGGAGNDWMQPTVTLHQAGIAMLLVEGNSGLGMNADDVHGSHHFITEFRNHWYGDIWNNPVKASNTTLIHLEAWTRFSNILGNVLGRSGYYTTYSVDQNTNDKAIITTGDPDNSPTKDARVKATGMFWGNYDTVTAATRWNASEVPSGITNFANPVPGNQNLPASFYLSSKPSFFGTTPYPAVGPDVTGGNGPAGHSYYIPAESCWYNVMKGVVGSSGALAFDADGCYAASTGSSYVAPPTGIVAAVD